MPAAAGVSVVLPLVVCTPLQLPDAVQVLVASIADQLSVAEPPSGMEAADKDRIGTTSAVSAWMNPYPELKFGFALAIGSAVFCNELYTRAGVTVALACRINAAIPAACGVAAEVPKKFG